MSRKASHASPENEPRVQGIVMIVAIAVLVLFALFTLWMTQQAGDEEIHWGRLTYLYQGVEAIVFAAAGAIFGTTVQRSNVAAAEKRESQAQAKADDNASDAESGRAVEAAIQSLLGAGPAGSDPPPVSDRIGASRLPSVNGSNEELLKHLLRVGQAVRDNRS